MELDYQRGSSFLPTWNSSILPTWTARFYLRGTVRFTYVEESQLDFPCVEQFDLPAWKSRSSIYLRGQLDFTYVEKHAYNDPCVVLKHKHSIALKANGSQRSISPARNSSILPGGNN